jgi:SAM-dependent methyltransferase
MWRILRLALRYRSDPLPYARASAELVVRYLRASGIGIRGGRWLDVGTGGGALPVALSRHGASFAAGLDLADRRLDGTRCAPLVRGSADRLPFATGSFDGVVSSNVLEHTPDTERAIQELLRVTRTGGIVYLSWTNWLSPVGGHEWSPFHYLGPRLGVSAYRAVRRKAPPWNVPFSTLFPVHVGPVVRRVRSLDVEVLDVTPRYWPALRVLAHIPGLREFFVWNCVILLRCR